MNKWNNSHLENNIFTKRLTVNAGFVFEWFMVRISTLTMIAQFILFFCLSIYMLAKFLTTDNYIILSVCHWISRYYFTLITSAVDKQSFNRTRELEDDILDVEMWQFEKYLTASASHLRVVSRKRKRN